MRIEDFHNIHRGETCLLVGNGKNLRLTPPEWFDYPSFGLNTCHLWDGTWKPTYYVAVDARVMREFGKEIDAKFRDIPCFLPRPNLEDWKGDNKVYWYFRPGSLWPKRQQSLWPSDLLSKDGIVYSNVMTAAMQIAYFMGFTTMLIIGMEHKEHLGQDHFWGCDHGMPADPPVQNWLDAYTVLGKGMAEQGVRVLNISENTCVPESILPRDDWRKWRNHETTDIHTHD